jgi:hypothetical protein
MIIRKHCVKLSNECDAIVVNNNVIERVSTFNYLGLYIDEFMSFKCHYDYVYKKISVNAGLICKLRKNITPHMLTLLINAYINSIIDYSLIVWGASRQDDFGKLQKVTQKILSSYYFPQTLKYRKKRFWCNLDKDEAKNARKECDIAFKNIDFVHLLEKHNLLSVSERFYFYSVWYIYKIRKFGSKIPYFIDLFACRTNNSTIVTRSKNACNIIKHKSSLIENSFAYVASKIWNDLPRNLCKTDDNNINFRKSINDWLINRR